MSTKFTPGEVAQALRNADAEKGSGVVLRLAEVVGVDAVNKRYSIKVGADISVHSEVPALSTYSAGVVGDIVAVLETGNSRLILGTRWA